MAACTVDGCEKPAALKRNGRPRHGGKCSAHAKRQTLGKPLSEPLREYRMAPGERLMKAAMDCADAPTEAEQDREFRRLWKLFRVHVFAYVKRRRQGRRKNVQPRPKTPRHVEGAQADGQA